MIFNQGAEHTCNRSGSHWWTWAICGLVGTTFGVLAFIWPETTVFWLALVFSAYAILHGMCARNRTGAPQQAAGVPERE